MQKIQEEDLPKMVGNLVHVRGFNPATVFRYLGDRDGRHLLETPTTRRRYSTRNHLLYTRKNDPGGMEPRG